MRAQIRGIYATALTEWFRREDWSIVHPSEPIDGRFSTSFSLREPDITIRTDDQGIGVSVVGEESAVSRAADRLGSVGSDAFIWNDPLPKAAVFDGLVIRTGGRGAIVDLGNDFEGYLPFDSVEAYVESGDLLRVQVSGETPPWSDERPELSATTHAPGTIVELRENESAPIVEAPNREIAGLVELLSVDIPEQWGSIWSPFAIDAPIDALEESLERVKEVSERIETAFEEVGEPSDPGLVVAPYESNWCWFGRRSRRTLDDIRSSVTPTIPGHHRIKAIGDSGATAVDFAETICDSTTIDEFPFGAVSDVFGPWTGSRVSISHGKPDGRFITLGTGEVTECESNGSITVERGISGGGTYDGLDVPKEEGDRAKTTFVDGRNWYPTVYLDGDGTRKGTYVNICTPLEIYPDTIRYIDLYVDVIRHVNGDVQRLDDDELDEAESSGLVGPEMAEVARSVADSIVQALED